MRRTRSSGSRHRGEKTTARKASGRERVLVAREPLPLAFAAALDVLARRRAAGEPLDRVVAAVARERHLGPRERRATADLAFSWARHANAVDGLVRAALRGEGGLSQPRRVMDLGAVCLAALAAGVDVDDRALAGLPDVLRTLVEDSALRGLELPVSLPPWLAARLRAAWPAQADELSRALARGAPTVLAVDTRRADREAVAAALLHTGVTTMPSSVAETALRVVGGRLSLSLLPAPLRNAVWPMDDGSQAVAHAVGARPGDRVLDLCAGGGGKARILAGTGARVVAADVDAGRLRRSLPAGVQGVVADGAAAPFVPGSFDRVLVDAPCSGTGTLRRAPDLALRLQEDDLPALIAVQRALLTSALRLVRSGGLVVYATCSLLPEENAGVVDAVLAGRADVIREPPPAVFGASGTLLPPTSDGFYVALLRKTA